METAQVKICRTFHEWNAYPRMEEQSQRNAATPEASPIFTSGMFWSSTRDAIDFKHSAGHVVGDEMAPTNTPKASLILLTGHENSSSRSFSWSFTISFSSDKKAWWWGKGNTKKLRDEMFINFPIMRKAICDMQQLNQDVEVRKAYSCSDTFYSNHCASKFISLHFFLNAKNKSFNQIHTWKSSNTRMWKWMQHEEEKHPENWKLEHNYKRVQAFLPRLITHKMKWVHWIENQ